MLAIEIELGKENRCDAGLLLGLGNDPGDRRSNVMTVPTFQVESSVQRNLAISEIRPLQVHRENARVIESLRFQRGDRVTVHSMLTSRSAMLDSDHRFRGRKDELAKIGSRAGPVAQPRLVPTFTATKIAAPNDVTGRCIHQPVISCELQARK